MCVFCGEDTDEHRNPFGYLASGVSGCRNHTDAEILRAWCEQRLADDAEPAFASDEVSRA
jgi:hypothetical protein